MESSEWFRAWMKRMEEDPLFKCEYALLDAQERIVGLEADLAECRDKLRGTYCAHCGEEFPLDDSLDDIHKHILVCERHPMRKLERELADCRDQNLNNVACYQEQVRELQAELAKCQREKQELANRYVGDLGQEVLRLGRELAECRAKLSKHPPE